LDLGLASESMQQIATILFFCAAMHTFLSAKFNQIATRFPDGSKLENLFHFLGEVEVVFGLWAAAFVVVWMAKFGSASATSYLESVNYVEAMFVFVIMTMAATKPIMDLARAGLNIVARMLPLSDQVSLYVSLMIVGPLLGSLITEPAAMTVSALILNEAFMKHSRSSKFKYASLGLLFVNVSIGGVLTHFAAPPVLMVSGVWGWDTPFMLEHFGWHSVLAVVVNAIGTAMMFRKEIDGIRLQDARAKSETPFWVSLVHVLFMIVVVMFSHHPVIFIPALLFFIGWCAISHEHQTELKLKEGLLVGFFLGGLVTLGKLQSWWIQPLIASATDWQLYWGATALTAVTDNAAITYLGTLVDGMSDTAKYFLVAGAVTGGGLTVIANAPNPAGYGILKGSFGANGVHPAKLFMAALPYTLIAAAFFSI